MTNTQNFSIPIAIQSFFLSQSSSFLQIPASRPNVCLIFERVLVQNILHGRSSALCKAIQSISRWDLIKYSLPHVILCSQTLFNEKFKEIDSDSLFHGRRKPLSFDVSETKLLYTLHWILLDAASECEDVDGSFKKRYLFHDMNSLQLFITMFSSIIDRVIPEDFQTLKLESGLRLWLPLKAKIPPPETSFCLSLAFPFNSINFSSAKAFQSQMSTLTDSLSCENCPDSLSQKVENYHDILSEFIFHKFKTVDEFLEKISDTINTKIMKESKPHDMILGTFCDLSVLRTVLFSDWNEDDGIWMAEYLATKLYYIRTYYMFHFNKRYKPTKVTENTCGIGNPLTVKCGIGDDRVRSKSAPDITGFREHRDSIGVDLDDDNVFEDLKNYENFDQTSSDRDFDQDDMTPDLDNQSTLDPKLSTLLNGKGKRPLDPKNEGMTKRHPYSSGQLIGERGSAVHRIKQSDQFDRISNHSLIINQKANNKQKFTSKIKISDIKEKIRRIKMKSNIQQLDSSELTEMAIFNDNCRQRNGKHQESSENLINLVTDPLKSSSPIRTIHQKQHGLKGNAETKFRLVKSATDTNLSYLSRESIFNVPGSQYYTYSNGEINYSIMLKALTSFVTCSNSLSISQSVIQAMFCLNDIGIFDIEKGGPKYTRHCDVRKTSTSGMNASQSRAFRPALRSHRCKKRIEKFRSHEVENRFNKKPPRSSDPFKNRDHVKDSDCKRSSTPNFSTLTRNRNKADRRVSVMINLNPNECDQQRKSDDDSDLDQRSTNSRIPIKSQGPRSKFYINSLENISESHNQSPLKMRNEVFDELGAPTSKPGKNHKSNLDHKNLHFSYYISEAENVENFLIGLHIVKKILTNLGCKYGHESPKIDHRFMKRQQSQESSTLPESTEGQDKKFIIDRIRSHCHTFLNILYNKNPVQFKRYFILFVGVKGIPEIVEFLHCLTGFCMDSSSDTRNRNYSNNFGAKTVNGEDIRGSEGIIISSLFSAFIRRLVRCRKELASQENMCLFTDIRLLTDYIKNIHGNVYRRVLLSALMIKAKNVSSLSMNRRQSRVMSIRPRMSSRNSMISCGIENPANRYGKRISMIHNPFPATLSSETEGNFRKAKRKSTIISGNFESPFTDEHSVNDESLKQSDNSYLQKTIRFIEPSVLNEALKDFSFLLECNEPGTMPEPQLIAALLDLDAPVISKACIYVELAMFVNRCNRGEFASWIKFNFPSSYKLSTDMNSRPSGPKDESQIQKQTGRLFYSWAEALSTRLGYIIKRCQENRNKRISRKNDECFLEDAVSEETYPYAFLTVAVNLLMEITAYLREMHLSIPASKSSSNSSKNTFTQAASQNVDEAPTNHTSAVVKNVKRRLSILVPIMSHSSSPKNEPLSCNSANRPLISPEEKSSGSCDHHFDLGNEQPLKNLPTNPRRISFAFSSESRERSSSLMSSNKEKGPKACTPSATNKNILKRLRGGSFKRNHKLTALDEPCLLDIQNNSHSLDEENQSRISRASSSSYHGVRESSLVDQNIVPADESKKSPQSNLTVTNQPTRIAILDEFDHEETSETFKSNVYQEKSRSGMKKVSIKKESYEKTQDPSSLPQGLPWLKTMINFTNLTDFSCDHVKTCTLNCFDRQSNQCKLMMNALIQVYSSEGENNFINSLGKHGEILNQFSSFTKTTMSTDSAEVGADSNDDSTYNSSDEQNQINFDETSGSGIDTPGKSSINGLSKMNGSIYNSNVQVSNSTFATNESQIGLLQKLANQNPTNAWPGEEDVSKKNFFLRNFLGKSNLGGNNNSSGNFIFDKLFGRTTSKNNLRNPHEDSHLANSANFGFSVFLSLVASSSGMRGSLTSDALQTDENGPFQPFNKTPITPASLKNIPSLRYLKFNVKSLRSSSLKLLAKGSLLLSEKNLKNVVSYCWEILLELDNELTSLAATMILIVSIRCSDFVRNFIFNEMCHINVDQRARALLKFRVIWNARHHFWCRLEDGAAAKYKLPPPFIEFVLPSPTLGHPGIDVPNCGWQIRKGTSPEEVQLKQNETAKTFVTASTTRRKQKKEMLMNAVALEKLQKKFSCRQYHFLNCAVLEKSAIEYSFSKEHREEAVVEENPAANSTNNQSGAVQEEFNAAVRRLSVAPINRSVNLQSRSFSWRNGSIPWFKNGTEAVDEHEGLGNNIFGLGNTFSLGSGPIGSKFLTLNSSVQKQYSQPVFPSNLSACIIPMVNLLDDFAVNSDGLSINSIAQSVIWQFLIEDTPLFLRFIFEKITRVDDRDNLISIIRRMIVRLPELPMQTAHTLFNNLIGYMMFHIRSPGSSAPESIGSSFTVLHSIIPYVQNIYFKDLKQTMRREQIDSNLLITANLPCAKQFNVFDDDVMVAQLVRLTDESRDYKFSYILMEALEGKGEVLSNDALYLLCDDRSNIIRNASHYVRDFYTFKRNHTPKLKIRKVPIKEGKNLLLRNAFNLKFQEIGKVLFASDILKYSSPAQVANHIFFLHEEFTKLPSFPRKALEAELSLYESSEGISRHLYSMDSIHKYSWIQLLRRMFDRMPATFPWSVDFQLFLNVFNGTLILHAEDSSILRHVLGCYIHCCHHFKVIFSINGFLGIMPTILRVYNQHFHNDLLRNAIEFVCKQFYIMHRTPFILQMFGSIANYVAIGETSTILEDTFYYIRPNSLYSLLRAIAKEIPDNYGILELCGLQMPLKPLDFCYAEEKSSLSLPECISMCIAVMVYSPESQRSLKMLTILHAILKRILKDLPQIHQEESLGGDSKKQEVNSIQQIGVAMKQLMFTTYWLIKRQDDIKVSTTNVTSQLAPGGPGERMARSANRSPVAESQKTIPTSSFGSSNKFRQTKRTHRKTYTLREKHESNNDASLSQSSSRRSGNVKIRQSILELSCEFIVFSYNRLNELNEKNKFNEILDSKFYLRLSEIVQSLIKQISSDPTLIKSPALQIFFNDVIHIIDWNHENVKSSKAFEGLIGRLHRTLPKTLDNKFIRMKLDWDALGNVLTSIQITMTKYPALCLTKEIKSLIDYLKRSILLDTDLLISNYISLATNINMQQNRVLSPDHPLLDSPKHSSPATNFGRSDANESKEKTIENLRLPNSFASVVIKMIGTLLYSLGSSLSLKDFCERYSTDYSIRCTLIFENGYESLSTYLSNIILPLLFRCSINNKDNITLTKENIFYALDLCLTALFAYVSDSPSQKRKTNNLSLSTNNSVNKQNLSSTLSSSSNQCGQQQSQSLSSPIELIQSSNLMSECDDGFLCSLSTLIRNEFYENNTDSTPSVPSPKPKQTPANSAKNEADGSFKAEFAHRLGYLGLKLILITYPRHSFARSRRILSVLAKMAHFQHGGINMWKFFDFIVTVRPPIFQHLYSFIRFKISKLTCETQGEQAYQQIVNQKLMGLHMPTPKTSVTLLRSLINDLKQIKFEIWQSKLNAHLSKNSHLNISKKPSPVDLQSVRGNRGQIAMSGDNQNLGAKILPSINSKNTNNESIEDMKILKMAKGSSGAQPSADNDPNLSTRLILQSDSKRRIRVHDGSRKICRHKSVSQKEPILTASAESLPRKTLGVTISNHNLSFRGPVIRRVATTNDRESHRAKNPESGQKLENLRKNNSYEDDKKTKKLLKGDDLTTSNPSTAVTIATSLYGSAAPYYEETEKVKIELNDMIKSKQETDDVRKEKTGRVICENLI